LPRSSGVRSEAFHLVEWPQVIRKSTRHIERQITPAPRVGQNYLTKIPSADASSDRRRFPPAESESQD
jgi:hypothetical protein